MSSQWGWAACSHSGEPHVGIWRHQGHVEMPESRRSRATARGRFTPVIRPAQFGQLQPLTTSEIRAGNDRSEGAAAIARCRKRGERSPKQTAQVLGRQPARKAHRTAADNGIEVALSTSSGQWRFRNPDVGIVKADSQRFEPRFCAIYPERSAGFATGSLAKP
jgi:hypothetical protein